MNWKIIIHYFPRWLITTILLISMISCAGALLLPEDTPDTIGIVFWLAAGFIGYAECVRLHRSQQKKREQTRGRCNKCGYDLRGLTERRCPECGTPIPDDQEIPDAED